MLEEEGVEIDGIYYCPHHTEGVIEKYKINCECRKPGPGMLLDAARRYNIDLTQSLMIGDSETDMLAGKNAGCRCALIRNSRVDEMSATQMMGIDYVVKDLWEAAKLISVNNDDESNFRRKLG